LQVNRSKPGHRELPVNDAVPERLSVVRHQRNHAAGEVLTAKQVLTGPASARRLVWGASGSVAGAYGGLGGG